MDAKLSTPKTPLMERLLRGLAHAVIRHPRWFTHPQMILFVVCVFYTVDRLEFSTNRNDLVGSDKKYHHNFLEYKKEFPGQDDLVVIVESDDPEKNRQFVERLGAKLETETNLFTDVFFKGDLKMMGNKALMFVPENDLVELQQRLRDYRPFIQNFSRATNLATLFQQVNTQFRTAKREASAENESLVKAIPALERIISQAADSLQRPGTPPSPGLSALFGGQAAEKEIYITYAGGKIFLATAHAAREELNFDAVKRLRVLIRETQAEVPGINLGLTGEPVLEHDEMEQSQRDTLLATLVSLVIVALIFIYGYSETGRPLKATACLILGLGYTMGFTTLVVGHLNILTITFAPMLIGLAIDFGVHLVTRYEEELRHGRTREEALTKAMVFTGMGIFTGCFTTAGAFLAMGITDFKGIQEMGIISCFGLIICLVPMMTLLPVLLLRGRQNVIDHVTPPAEDPRARIERLWLDRPYVVIAVTVLTCGLAATQFRKVHFDYNLLNLQSADLPAVTFAKKLIHSASNSVLFGAAVATNLSEAVALEAKFTNLSSVAQVRSMSLYLAEDSTRKLGLIRGIKSEAAALQFPALDDRPASVEELSQVLFSLQGYLGLAAQEVHKEGDTKLAEQLLSLRKSIDPLRARMLGMDRGVSAEKLGAFQQKLLADLQETFTALRNQDATGRLQARDLPPALRNRFVGVTGKYLLQVYPKQDVWQRGPQEKFVEELRSVDPAVTGTPVQLLEYATLLKNSYVEAAFYSLAAIALLVFLHFRSVICVILALLPVAIGTIWMVGWMGWQGLSFNLANIMTLPLVIGIGVTNGIHILNRFAEEQHPGILAKSTGKAVLVSGLTTIAGFGSLILAKHQGIESLGYVMSAGVGTCMLAGLTFLPALLNSLVRRGWRLKKTQWQ
ncbi:MAG: MMPL family transporter [Verrucomicrobia bacterium]|nr:MMPL family transporter [Verrucomicrobiota bacterium]